MHRRRKGSVVVTVPLLGLVAIAGYLAGHGRPAAGRPEAMREAAGTGVVLEYPTSSGWRAVPDAPQIAGLPIGQPVALAPGGRAQQAGLIAGRLTGNGTSVLPQSLLAGLKALPRVEVVELQNTQAYRYSLTGTSLVGVGGPGGGGSGEGRPAGPRAAVGDSGGEVVLYVVPDSPFQETAIVCYTTSAPAGDLRACESIAALAWINQSAESVGNSLLPDVPYAQKIAADIHRLDALRASLRRRLHVPGTPAVVARLSAQLAQGLSAVGQALAVMQPPPAAEWAQSDLAQALWNTRAAYLALGSAAQGAGQLAYAHARGRVESAEAGIDNALLNFTLMGYR